MKFNEKYPNAKPGDITDEDTLLVSDHEEPCVECGNPTRFIDYCGESRLCSEKCSDKHWTKINAACNTQPDDDFDEEMNDQKAIAKLDEFIKITKHDTPYYRGLVNGMILAKSIFTGENPTYFGPTYEDGNESE